MKVTLKSLQSGSPPSSEDLIEYLRTLSPSQIEIYQIRYVLYRLISDPGKNSLSVETLMVAAIHVGSLPLLSFGLRKFDSQSNWYVNTEDQGQIHWLVYLYRIWPDLNSLPTAATLFILKGAQITDYAYIQTEKATSKPTVNETIHLDHGSEADIPEKIGKNLSNLSKVLKPEDVPVLGIYLDDPEFTRYSSDNVGQVEMMFVLHSQTILDDPALNIRGPIDLGIDTIELVGFRKSLSSVTESYFLLNKIISRMTSVSDQPILLDGYVELLISAIEAGFDLDPYQARALERSLPSSVYRRILIASSTPSWKKVCSSEGPLDSRVLELARGLGIDYTADKEFICDQLNMASQVDPERLLSRSENSEKKRFLLETSGKQPGKFTDLSPEAVQTAKCSNDDFRFGTSESVYFEDSAGSWCVSPDKFKSLLLDRVNPYTGKPLSMGILRQISDCLTTSKDYQLTEQPISFQNAINRLLTQKITRSDQIDNSLSQAQVAAFESRGIQYGVVNPQEYLTRLVDPSKWISEAADYLGGSKGVEMINGLSIEHAYVTLARLANSQFNTNPELAKSFFTKFFSKRFENFG